MFLATLVTAAVLHATVPESGSFRGEVAIEGFQDRGAIVFVDTNGDGSLDHVFRLQVEGRRVDPIGPDTKLEHEIGGTSSISGPATTHYSNAAVEFAPGYVRVVAGGEAMEFFVEGTQSAVWNPSGARVWRRAGYALIHEARETGVAIRRQGNRRSITAEYCDASTDCDPGDTDGGGTWNANGGGTLCDSGGPGSTSCSVSNGGGTCTSSCGVGYYACCMYGAPPKCRCIRGG